MERIIRRAVAGSSMLLCAAVLAACGTTGGGLARAPLAPPADRCDAGARLVKAEVVALDQAITYNRFGSFNPYGMIYALKLDVVPTDADPVLRPGAVRLRDGLRPRPLILRGNDGDCLEVRFTNLLREAAPDLSDTRWKAPYANLNAPAQEDEEDEAPVPPASAQGDGNWPETRRASIVVDGLTPIGDTRDALITGIEGVEPGESVTYRWKLRREGAHLFYSNAAPAGGQGDGGSLVHGLFGMVVVEPKGSRWYRSQVDAGTLARAWGDGAALDYEATDEQGHPLLGMLKRNDDGSDELVRGDLTAVVVAADPGQGAHREFSIVFHDELKTFYADEFKVLGEEAQLAGVRDGFAINYGSSGMGAILLANRKGIGPAKDCVECMYEEFFLQSWANGDPALLARFQDDPSNVYHSYQGDRVKFLNAHAGPKETHVFHLHAHQWLSRAGTDGSYLDSQTIAPLQTFSYEIHWGGSGNRNLTPGDSIFHCHLYPHFAQGMWSLWRVHDVLEDGTRRLPDGESGAGTDPLTGATAGGTPIPALVPLPRQAMPPRPSYGEQGFPGYPFYLAGTAGHRAPQAPLDIAESGGLGRHVVTGGARRMADLDLSQTRARSADALVEYAIEHGDFTAALVSADIRVLPEDGTPLEKRAMDFHAARAPGLAMATTGAHPAYLLPTPEGTLAPFRVNGAPPVAGAPFADPCRSQLDDRGELPPRWDRVYRVSAIQTDLRVNSAGWHDPQARINVLDQDVARFENGPTDEARPFFFRAHSGDCIRFFHTNRTPLDLELDDFQVATPTDTIGQHIHLVKFDVTASDGSGNGFNYEDGTFAYGAIEERVHASAHPRGSARDIDGNPVTLHAKRTADGQPVYQTTVQRWWADPLLVRHDDPATDQTIRTVFTHDHFGPSSIQQHGFYSALLVEPAGSEWYTPSGQRMCDSLQPAPDGSCRPPVGTQAIIRKAGDGRHAQADHREFALAIADFALLYAGNIERNGGTPRHHDGQGMYGLAAARDCRGKPDTPLCRHARAWREKHGNPVDAPAVPEAISTDHHNPYLVNYRNDPVPLRQGEYDASSGQAYRQRPGPKGEAANLFSSVVHGRDPDTEIFEAYEGEQVQFRVIQGAQEVQHVFTLHGLRWPREPRVGEADRQYVGAQEIGISEHFEMELPPLRNVDRGAGLTDVLYSFGSADALWNGAWGLLRAYNGIDASDASAADCDARDYAARHIRGEAGPDPRCGTRIGRRLQPVAKDSDGKITQAQWPAFAGCPAGATATREFFVQAWQSPAEGMPYDPAHGVRDPDALAYVLVGDRSRMGQCDSADAPGPAAHPLVLRLRAGECAKVELRNCFDRDRPLRDQAGDALMPKIVSLNVEDDGEGRQLRPSSHASLHPQVIGHDHAAHAGLLAGLNNVGVDEGTATESGIAAPGETAFYYWYAGRYDKDDADGRYKARPVEFGATGLVSFADPIQHGVAGLVGALIVEPPDTVEVNCGQDPCFNEPATKPLPTTVSARLSAPSRGGAFREHVVIIRDGLNLWQDGRPIRDCPVCDDSYDLGEQGVNYATAAFRPRLGLGPDDNPDLNFRTYPAGFFDGDRIPVATPRFTADTGEQVVFRVVHPAGRARQHSFVVYGHNYPDLLTGQGSPGSALMSVGKALNAWLDTGAACGDWLYRDGVSHLYAGGIWGEFRVGRGECAVPEPADGPSR